MTAPVLSVTDTVSLWVGRPGAPPWWACLAEHPHEAASTMKLAVLVALYRSGLDLDAPVPVANSFASALGDGSRYDNDPGYDNETEVWDRIGGTATLRWLARRMIVRSGNLAANLVLDRVGLPAVAEVWRLAGATGAVTARGIEDHAARDAGLHNVTTAAGLAALLSGLSAGTIADAAACAEMLALLAEQEDRDGLTAGLPEGVRVAHKGGWVDGVRHSAGLVHPDDAPPFLVVVCTTTSMPDDDACRLVANVASAAWNAREAL